MGATLEGGEGGKFEAGGEGVEGSHLGEKGFKHLTFTNWLMMIL